ncbi:MAG: S-methyl-5-thioribose-1-phosphate isomerase, partial [Myxococcota bacterium]|nr:S-methyl-5-thioribose-1-phosphate isomerase [Myxococcota bacterium]
INQPLLPPRCERLRLSDWEAAARAIKTLQIRGAPLIGAVGAYGLAFALREDPSDTQLTHCKEALFETRPTAVNLRWALDRVSAVVVDLPPAARAARAYEEAAAICDEDVALCEQIGRQALPLFREAAAARNGEPLRVLTHCNAGWLATVDWGTALAPIYMAHDEGIPLHVWVDETRPRNQGARLTAWELGAHGVPHQVIVDNAGGHLMQRGEVDLCIVGTDRTTRAGDVCNKIGTYLKALAARDNGVPFYVALPSPTIDWSIRDGLREIPIEGRSGEEVHQIQGVDSDGALRRVRLTPEASDAANPAFDVTPAHLVTALITERGVCAASETGLTELFPEHRLND